MKKPIVIILVIIISSSSSTSPARDHRLTSVLLQKARLQDHGRSIEIDGTGRQRRSIGASQELAGCSCGPNGVAMICMLLYVTV
mmetsp:Transcript_95047/g.198679  ORF Transcript_95047/g.198679 Transcript_95047/m.198679 type:complete len:84 (-) Transcript_95047:291-542(-)